MSLRRIKRYRDIGYGQQERSMVMAGMSTKRGISFDHNPLSGQSSQID